LVKDRVTLELKHTFKCGPADLFACFVDPYRAKAFGGDQAIVSDQPKASFSLFGGHVSGENVEVVSVFHFISIHVFNCSFISLIYLIRFSERNWFKNGVWLLGQLDFFRQQHLNSQRRMEILSCQSNKRTFLIQRENILKMDGLKIISQELRVFSDLERLSFK